MEVVPGTCTATKETTDEQASASADEAAADATPAAADAAGGAPEQPDVRDCPMVVPTQSMMVPQATEDEEPIYEETNELMPTAGPPSSLMVEAPEVRAQTRCLVSSPSAPSSSKGKDEGMGKGELITPAASSSSPQPSDARPAEEKLAMESTSMGVPHPESGGSNTARRTGMVLAAFHRHLGAASAEGPIRCLGCDGISCRLTRQRAVAARSFCGL